MLSLNMNSSKNVEKLMSINTKPVFNQVPNRCSNQRKRKINSHSMCMGAKDKTAAYKTGEKQQLYIEDGFRQNESRNVVINLNCGHDVTLNFHGIKHESDGTINQEFAAHLPNYDELCGSNWDGIGKQCPSFDYQEKCYFY